MGNGMVDKQRMADYVGLIEQLLRCDQGREAEVLQANAKLVDAGLLKMMGKYADAQEAQGGGNWLRQLASNLGGKLGMLMLDERNIGEIHQFLLETLRVVAVSEGDSQQVYPVWTQQQTMLNEELIAVMPQVVSQLFSQGPEEKAFIAGILVNLGNLIQQFSLETSSLNLEIAIAAYELALQVLTRESFPEDWAATQNNLAIVYSKRIQGERTDNIEQAITACKLALQVYTHESFPEDWAMTHNNLANAYTTCIWSQNADNIQQAIIAYRKALMVYKCKVNTFKCCKIARNLGNLYFEQENWLDAAIAYTLAFQSSVILYQDCFSGPDKARELSQNAGLSHRTAYSLARAGKYKRAVTTLERSRARALSESLKQNHSYHPNLNTKCNHPLVYLLHTSAGSLALIIVMDRIDPIWLNDWNDEKQLEVLINWLGKYKEYDDHRNAETTRVWYETICTTTNQLWEPLMAPLIEKLKSMKIDRATLIPTGLLSFLPLHAAWTEDPSKPTGRHYAIDDIHFTYAPNAKSLTAAQTIADRIQPNTILAIDNPQNNLPNSQREINAAIETFTHQTVLRHTEATVEAVRSKLREAAIVHFSCHGTANLNDPLNSGLLMSDGLLTLKDIFALNLAQQNQGIRLAILSACETGMIGIENADEAVSLPTGLLQAGVAAVIASLWSVSDLSTMLLLTKFYDLWREQNLPADQALRQAQIWLRDTTNGEKVKELEIVLAKFDNPLRISESTARILYDELGFEEPSDRTFAHPFHWAAFGYTGV